MLSDTIHAKFVSGVSLLQIAAQQDLTNKEVYSLLKVGRVRSNLAEVTWLQLSESSCLSGCLLAWVSIHLESWQCLPEDLRLQAYFLIEEALGTAALQDVQEKHEASLPALHESTCDPLAQESTAALAASPTLEPWQHPILCQALVGISGGEKLKNTAHYSDSEVNRAVKGS